ncbi:uncharacterized protein LOC130785273 [Actinidia eriantha]|uniref:uncharacterized protein LOC130785273 n=1 Tax=Actinidia eriantha TaxID=165200 RepID=UPI00258E1B0F|nr:uncharacterized protein LOC130785273 [Actinidia eriantha]XP_057501394.1 uncharacterized protein LOC130785273 [Actinidia eriantha]XP_057501395.1 uncharacterized protein LOC130785273 [Actinidia eriantha]XP_057501396.1 uncharacterized protein LOC130785273 [Actinidia eriantha]XP_057501397.1 uncharacterized protein LOC130785273 [Actinidia eriantha]XP_057501399.1 uncharacterized protein LOC130785273 [Actinidia eriantha]
MRKGYGTLTASLASGDGPGFGHLPDLFSRNTSSHEDFCLSDFFSDRLRNPSIAGVGTDREYSVRSHAVLRVVVNDRCALVRSKTLRLGPEFKLVLFDSLVESGNGEKWIETVRLGDEYQGPDSIARFDRLLSLSSKFIPILAKPPSVALLPPKSSRSTQTSSTKASLCGSFVSMVELGLELGLGLVLGLFGYLKNWMHGSVALCTQIYRVFNLVSFSITQYIGFGVIITKIKAHDSNSCNDEDEIESLSEIEECFLRQFNEKDNARILEESIGDLQRRHVSPISGFTSHIESSISFSDGKVESSALSTSDGEDSGVTLPKDDLENIHLCEKRG